jgi:hypothetical protein
MSNAQPQPLKPGLSTHESGPRAGDIGSPKWSKSLLSEKLFPPGPSIERIEFVSRTIMTGQLLFRNREKDFIACF